MERDSTTSQHEPLPLKLELDEAHIWLCRLDPPQAILRQGEHILSLDERAHCQRLRFERDRRRFLAAHSLLHQLHSFYLNIPPERIAFQYGSLDKPALASGFPLDVHFNLSHSHDIALYVFALGREVGVDIERICPLADLDAIAGRFFSSEEQRELFHLPPDMREQAFFACWTRKEAYVKAIGDGLSTPLDRFTVPLTITEKVAHLVSISDQTKARQWQLYDLPLSAGYAGALAVEGNPIRLSLMQWGISRFALWKPIGAPPDG